MMATKQVSRDAEKADIKLSALAAAVRKHVDGARRGFRDALTHAIEAGSALIAAKAQLKHGEWLPWLKEHCDDLSARQAQTYMKLARRKEDVLKNADTAHMAIRTAERMLEMDAEIRGRERREFYSENFPSAPEIRQLEVLDRARGLGLKLQSRLAEFMEALRKLPMRDDETRARLKNVADRFEEFAAEIRGLLAGPPDLDGSDPVPMEIQ